MKQAAQDRLTAALLGGLTLAVLGGFLYIAFSSMTW
jgi:hypothetical protein